MSAPSPDPTPTGAGATALGGPSGSVAPAGVAGPDDRSVGELVSSLSADLSRLVRDEMRLAQAEVTDKAKKAGVGVGAFGAAGVLALYAVGVLLAAAVLGLATALPAWLSALIIERGRHAELLAADGRYAELYRTQFASGPDGATAVAPREDAPVTG